MIITGSNNLVGFTAVLYIHLARNGMAFPVSKLSFDTKSHHSIPSFVISEAFWSQESWEAEEILPEKLSLED